MDRPSRIGRVYLLRDPNTGCVRYVGATSHELRERARGHYQLGCLKSWIASLLPAKPIIELIEETAFHMMERREQAWIRHFKEAGADLLNRKITKPRRLPVRSGTRKPRPSKHPSGYTTRVNIALCPADDLRLDRLMNALSCSRSEAIRRAVAEALRRL